MNIADLIFDEKMIMIMTSDLTFYKKKTQHDHDRDIWSKHLIKKYDHD